MIIKKAELETVAVKRSQYPEDNVPEIAFAGDRMWANRPF